MGGNSRQEYLAAIQQRYHQSTREEKGLILQEFCAVCGYHRKHAIRLLNRHQKRPRRRPGRKPVYHSPELLTALKRIWLATDQMCSKKPSRPAKAGCAIRFPSVPTTGISPSPASWRPIPSLTPVKGPALTGQTTEDNLQTGHGYLSCEETYLNPSKPSVTFFYEATRRGLTEEAADSCARRVFRPDGKAIVTRGDLKITPPQNTCFQAVRPSRLTAPVNGAVVHPRLKPSAGQRPGPRRASGGVPTRLGVLYRSGKQKKGPGEAGPQSDVFNPLTVSAVQKMNVSLRNVIKFPAGWFFVVPL